MKISIYLSLIFCLLPAATVRAQMDMPPGAPGMRQQFDSVSKLNKYLELAGADQLSDAQKQQIDSLVSNYRTAHQNVLPDTTTQAARRDYEAAILSGNEGAANAAADVVTSEMERRLAALLHDLAQFQIQVLRVLTPAQVTALKTQYGNSGLIRTLGSLAGNQFGMVHGMMRPGMHR